MTRPCLGNRGRRFYVARWLAHSVLESGVGMVVLYNDHLPDRLIMTPRPLRL